MLMNSDVVCVQLPDRVTGDSVAGKWVGFWGFRGDETARTGSGEFHEKSTENRVRSLQVTDGVTLRGTRRYGCCTCVQLGCTFWIYFHIYRMRALKQYAKYIIHILTTCC